MYSSFEEYTTYGHIIIHTIHYIHVYAATTVRCNYAFYANNVDVSVHWLIKNLSYSQRLATHPPAGF